MIWIIIGFSTNMIWFDEYLKSSNGTLTLYGGVGMALCDGTLPNPSPQLTVYKKECK